MKVFSLFTVSYASLNPIHQELVTELAEIRERITTHSQYGDKDLKDAVAAFAAKGNERNFSAEDMTPVELRSMVAEGNNLNLKQIIAYWMGKTDAERGSKKGKGEDTDLGDDDKWCNYGCYCTPHHRHMADGNWVGRGKPVDAIDALCQRLWNCYQCLEKDISKCTMHKPYEWGFNNKDQAFCKNKEDTCKGELCRCDLEFGMELDKIRDQWKRKFHMHHGFNRQQQCQPIAPGPRNGDRVCCNKRLDYVLYNKSKQDCCSDGSLAPLGTC